MAYFLIPLRNTLMNVFRWCMYLAGWASVMAVRHRESMYSYVLRAIVSVVLLWTARGLGIAFARGISIKFYSANYFTKMQVRGGHGWAWLGCRVGVPLHRRTTFTNSSHALIRFRRVRSRRSSTCTP